MGADIEHMEHRWGTRVELDIPAEIRTGDGLSVSAFVRNASLSGAFVETQTILPMLSCISVRVMSQAGEWLDACVVRIEETGMALEWLDPGSDIVPALLELRGDSRGEVLQTVPERVFNVLAASRT
ncbi:MAG: PilZ domain-containing protein [Pseudomonadota bacterium]